MTTWYLGANRGQFKTGDVTVGTSSPGSTDFVLAIDALDANSVAVTKEDVILALRMFERYILGNFIPSGSPGTDLPPL